MHWMRSVPINWDLTVLIADTTIWEIGSDSVGNGPPEVRSRLGEEGLSLAHEERYFSLVERAGIERRHGSV